MGRDGKATKWMKRVRKEKGKVKDTIRYSKRRGSKEIRGKRELPRAHTLYRLFKKITKLVVYS